MQTINVRECDEFRPSAPTRNFIDITKSDGIPTYTHGIKRYGDALIVSSKPWLVPVLYRAFTEGEAICLSGLGGYSVTGFISVAKPLGCVDGLPKWEFTFKHSGPPRRERATPGLLTPDYTLHIPDAPSWIASGQFLAGAIKQSEGRMRRMIDAHLDEYMATKHNFPCITEGWDMGLGESVNTSTRGRKKMKVRNKYYIASQSMTTEKEQGQDNIPPAKPGDVPFDMDRNVSGRWTRKDLKDVIAQASAMLDKNPTQDHVAIVKIIRVVRRKKMPVIVEVIK